MNKNEETISAAAMLLSIAKADDIIDDGELNPVRDWFPIDSDSSSKYPITIFIDHNMRVFDIKYLCVYRSAVSKLEA